MPEPMRRAWRLTAVAVVGAAGIGSLLGSGSAGGPATIGAVSQKVNVLPSYGYSIGPAAASEPLTATIRMPDGPATIAIDLADTVSGTARTVAGSEGNVVLDPQRIDAGSRITVDSNVAVPVLGAFDVNVASALAAPAEGFPTSGRLDVSFANDVVSVSAEGGGRVSVGLNLSIFTDYAWEDFRRLFQDATAPDWVRRASLGADALELVNRQAFAVAEVFDSIDASLAAATSLEVMCDAFPKSPPPGVLPQGLWTLTWLGAGEIEPGNDFEWVFSDCWRADLDRLERGRIALRGYVRAVTEGRLTRIGFEGTGTNGGGVTLDGFRIERTVEGETGYVIDPVSAVAVSGSFDVTFFVPPM